MKGNVSMTKFDQHQIESAPLPMCLESPEPIFNDCPAKTIHQNPTDAISEDQVVEIVVTREHNFRRYDPSAAAAAEARGDFATAFQMTLDDAESGVDEAQHNLGISYMNALGVPQNYSEALKWFRLAAEQGLDEAQNNLGTMYRRGEGVPVNFTEALKWFRLAAAQGCSNAQYNLGQMYLSGEGVPKSYAIAVIFYELAAAQGDEDAQRKALKYREFADSAF